ncbi:MAG TPA: hypothetical protein VFJ90_04170 [Candidatus Didemnitutus sp.]|nr:hypothetical protein [Candidatus Didemnitutus sp.]
MSFTQLLISALIIALLIWRLQARWKNYVGRQRFVPSRLIVFTAVFVTASVVVAILSLSHHLALEMFGCGLVGGALLSLVGLWLTRFEFTSDGTYFTPNSHLGVALTLLLGVQFIYRKVVMHVDPNSSAPPPSIFDNQPVFVMLGVTAGYFIAYNVGVLIRGRKD